jgi:hypothetical protein
MPDGTNVGISASTSSGSIPADGSIAGWAPDGAVTLEQTVSVAGGCACCDPPVRPALPSRADEEVEESSRAMKPLRPYDITLVW